MRIFILVLSLLGAAFAVPLYIQKLDEAILLTKIAQGKTAFRDTFFEAIIRGMIEDFRETMVTGSDTIPVLDPLELDHLTIDDEILPFPRAQVKIDDLVVKYLSKFDINSLSVVMVSLFQQIYTIDLDISIPEVEAIVGNYDLLLDAMGYNIFGNGKANVKVIRPRVKATITANLRISGSGISFNLNDVRIEFGLDGFEPDITGLFNDDAASGFVSTVLKFLVPDLVELYEDEINDFLSELVFELVNGLL